MARIHLPALATLLLLGSAVTPATSSRAQPAAGGPIPAGTCNGRSMFTFALPRNSGPESLATQNGRLYFPMGFGSNRVGRMDLAGNVATTAVPDSNHTFGQITPLPGTSLLWLAQPDSNRVGLVSDANGSFGVSDNTPNNLVPTQRSGPTFVAVGPDGYPWFTEASGDKVGRINVNTGGGITEISPLGPGSLKGIAPGPDGNLYVADSSAHVLWTVHPSSASITLTQPNLYDTGDPFSVALGPDGALWFTEPGLHRIGRMTVAGVTTFFALPDGQDEVPQMITAGNDGALWFTERVANTDYIGRITPTGVVTHCAVPNGENPRHFAFGGITVGPDGNMWFAGEAHDQLVQVVTPDNAREGVTADLAGRQHCPPRSAGPSICVNGANIVLHLSMPPNQPANRTITLAGIGPGFTIRGSAVTKVSYVVWKTPLAQIEITGRITQASGPFQPGDQVLIILNKLAAGGAGTLVVTRGNFNVLAVGFIPSTQHTIIIR